MKKYECIRKLNVVSVESTLLVIWERVCPSHNVEWLFVVRLKQIPMEPSKAEQFGALSETGEGHTRRATNLKRKALARGARSLAMVS